MYDLIDNQTNLINKILQEKHVIITRGIYNGIWAQILQEKYSIPIHLSEQKLFLSLFSIAFSKYLPEKYLNKINLM